jgi:hypothetical protein
MNLVGLKTNILIWETLYIMNFLGLGHSGLILWIPRWSWSHKLVEHLVHSEQLFSVCTFPFLIQVNTIPYHNRYFIDEPVFWKRRPGSCLTSQFQYFKVKITAQTPTVGMKGRSVLLWGKFYIIQIATSYAVIWAGQRFPSLLLLAWSITRVLGTQQKDSNSFSK